MPRPLENLPSPKTLFDVARSFLSLNVPDESITDWVNHLYDPKTRNITHLNELTGIHNRTLTRLHRHMLLSYPELGKRYGRMFPRSTREPNRVKRRDKTGDGEDRPVSKEALKNLNRDPAPPPPAPPDLSKIGTKEGQIEALTKFMWQAAQEEDYRQFIAAGEQRAKLQGDFAPEVSVELQVQQILPEGGPAALPSEVTRLMGLLREQGIIEAEIEALPEPEDPSE